MQSVRLGFVLGGGGNFLRSEGCPHQPGCCFVAEHANIEQARSQCPRFRWAWRSWEEDAETARWAYFADCADSVEEAVALSLMED
jgi:hypothetical protein